MNTSKRLKYIRQRTGLSQSRFAITLDETLSRINSIEGGKQLKFPYDLAEKILNKFPEENYNFKWITTGKGSPHNAEKGVINNEKSLNLLDNITGSEFKLISDCLKDNKELTIMLLKKLKQDIKPIKSFLLDN